MDRLCALVQFVRQLDLDLHLRGRLDFHAAGEDRDVKEAGKGDHLVLDGGLRHFEIGLVFLRIRQNLLHRQFRVRRDPGFRSVGKRYFIVMAVTCQHLFLDRCSDQHIDRKRVGFKGNLIARRRCVVLCHDGGFQHFQGRGFGFRAGLFARIGFVDQRDVFTLADQGGLHAHLDRLQGFDFIPFRVIERDIHRLDNGDFPLDCLFDRAHGVGIYFHHRNLHGGPLGEGPFRRRHKHEHIVGLPAEFLRGHAEVRRLLGGVFLRGCGRGVCGLIGLFFGFGRAVFSARLPGRVRAFFCVRRGCIHRGLFRYGFVCRSFIRRGFVRRGRVRCGFVRRFRVFGLGVDRLFFGHGRCALIFVFFREQENETAFVFGSGSGFGFTFLFLFFGVQEEDSAFFGVRVSGHFTLRAFIIVGICGEENRAFRCSGFGVVRIVDREALRAVDVLKHLHLAADQLWRSVFIHADAAVFVSLIAVFRVGMQLDLPFAAGPLRHRLIAAFVMLMFFGFRDRTDEFLRRAEAVLRVMMGLDLRQRADKISVRVKAVGVVDMDKEVGAGFPLRRLGRTGKHPHLAALGRRRILKRPGRSETDQHRQAEQQRHPPSAFFHFTQHFRDLIFLVLAHSDPSCSLLPGSRDTSDRFIISYPPSIKPSIN